MSVCGPNYIIIPINLLWKIKFICRSVKLLNGGHLIIRGHISVAHGSEAEWRMTGAVQKLVIRWVRVHVVVVRLAAHRVEILRLVPHVLTDVDQEQFRPALLQLLRLRHQFGGEVGYRRIDEQNGHLVTHMAISNVLNVPPVQICSHLTDDIGQGWHSAVAGHGRGEIGWLLVHQGSDRYVEALRTIGVGDNAKITIASVWKKAVDELLDHMRPVGSHRYQIVAKGHGTGCISLR